MGVLEALNNELGWLKQQPKVNEDRVAQVEAEIKAATSAAPPETPAEPEPEPPVVETTQAPATEQAVPAKPKRRTAKD